jgi:anti-sigma-K factor RskA
MDAANHSPELLELISVYALGALDGEDLRTVLAHLATGCPECQARLAETAADLEEIAGSLPPVQPAETTRARLLAKLPAASGGEPRRTGRGWLAAAAGLAALLLLAAGWGWLAARREAEALRASQAVRGDLERQMAALSRDLAATRSQNARLARALATLSAPGMRPVALAALKAPAGAQGYAFVDPAGHRAVFVAANLPALPPDKTYELWFIADGKPVAAGTFGVDPSGRSGTVEVEGVAPVERIQAWAVTVEPQGGVPQPTGTMVLKG